MDVIEKEGRSNQRLRFVHGVHCLVSKVEIPVSSCDD